MQLGKGATPIRKLDRPAVVAVGTDVALDIARITPTPRPAASANFCAWARASAIKSDNAHACDCCNCADTCVPWTWNVTMSPLFFFATFCCTVVSVPIVSLILDNGTGRVNDH